MPLLSKAGSGDAHVQAQLAKIAELVQHEAWPVFVEVLQALGNARINAMRACDGGAQFHYLKGCLDTLDMILNMPINAFNQQRG